MTIRATVVIPTHNRPGAIRVTVDSLLVSAERASAEIVVVDDGSEPPLTLPHHERLRLVRTTGVERSSARNYGAGLASADVLVFIDDDIIVGPEFVEQHLQATREFEHAICVGRITLPIEMKDSPFGRFRRSIEEPSQVRPRGLVAQANFCTAANMSIPSSDFLSLGGFDPAIVSGEDQDLALRFSQRGGRIAFLPEAEALHRDEVADITAYCSRHEWGAKAMAPLLRRYPHRPENEARVGLAAPLQKARTPRQTARILVRLLLTRNWALGWIQALTKAAERAGAGDELLLPLYRLLLGLHMFRGLRAGLTLEREAPPLPGRLDPRGPASCDEGS